MVDIFLSIPPDVVLMRRSNDTSPIFIERRGSRPFDGREVRFVLMQLACFSGRAIIASLGFEVC